MAGELERMREVAKKLRAALAQVSELSDIALSEATLLEPWDSPELDLSYPRTEEIVVTGIGLALQVLIAPNQVGTVRLCINRLDGFQIDPAVDSLVPIFPIAKIFLVVKEGASGKLKFRVYKDPSFLFTATPEVQIGYTKLKNSSETIIDPATEPTLASALQQLQQQTPELQRLTKVYSAGTSGQVSVTTAGAQLPNIPVPVGGCVSLWADSTNSDEVAVNIGSAAVVGTHAGLRAGQGLDLPVDNANRIYLKAAAGTQKINYIVLTS
ncbi:MAG: hypothetical protein QXS54_07465 [Candidatus Methanomethylicaceae archaeon]